MAREVDTIKEKVDVVDFLRSYITLIPAGKNFKALCPFHGEKTPSFIVSPERRSWHCFGCSIGGDVIAFLMRYEHIEFPEALRILAERIGITLEGTNQREQREFNVLYDIHESASKYFEEALTKNIEAQKYLEERKLSKGTREEFHVGYAIGGDGLVVYLIREGYDIRDIVKAGLAQKNMQGLYRDRFRARIVFPIANSLGKIVAFTGRIIPSQQTNDTPKYLNSPETPIFNKSKVLYGFDKTKNNIATTRTVVLVEGQMDFFGMWESGVQNVVAVSGTALSQFHLEKLRRIAETVVLSFDNDEAGFNALERAIIPFHSFDFHVRGMTLGEFKDPGEAAQKDPNFLKKAAQEAKPAFGIIIDYHLSKISFNDIAEKKRGVRRILLLLQKIKSAVEQNEWLEVLAQKTHISINALSEELRDLKMNEKKKEEVVVEKKEVPKERIHILSRRLTALALTESTFFDMLKEILHYLPESYRLVLQNPKSATGEMLELEGSYMMGSADKEDIQKEFTSLLSALESEYFKKEREKVREEIRVCEQEGNEEGLVRAMARFSELSEKINKK